MRVVSILFFFAVTLTAADTDPLYDGAHGLRAARRIDAQTVRLSFGASLVTSVAAQNEAYRIVSPDDPAFMPGIRSTKAVVSESPDVTPPDGWKGKPFKRYTVIVTLPQPMKTECRYWVQALGYKGRLLTGGCAARWIENLDDASEKVAAERNALGVRSIEWISPRVLQLTTGPGLDPARFDTHPEVLILKSSDDPDFKDGRKAAACGRRSRGDTLHPDGWPWTAYLQHELFLEFDAPVKSGHTYTLDFNAAAPLICGQSQIEFRADDRTAVNPALKVNQLGYLPDAPAKYAYLGAWMGSLGACDFSAVADHFEVRNAATHAPVLSGKGKLRHKSGEKNESVYKDDFSFENVYELDFSALKEEGDYYVCVPGAGRSFTFKIAKDIYKKPFEVMMTGVLHQRCGIEMKAPFSDHYRPACHRNCTELTDLVRTSEAEAFKELPKHVIDAKKHDLFGGHHDAGDYNPRSHLEIAENAFLLYEIKPAAFTDGQLRIPESANGIPDLLDEARWALDLWMRLQDTDGGVRNGTESDGDPDMLSPAEIDPKRDFAFAKDTPASLRFAACAAQAALIWEQLKKPDDSAAFLKSAVRAWEWSMKNSAEKLPDALTLAAIQLYRATGEQKYLDAFNTHSVFKRLPNAQLEEWQKYDQRDASFFYAICSRPIDAAIKARIVEAFKSMATGWCAAGETCAYRFVKHPYAPISWGAGAHPQSLLPIIQAQTLAPNPLFLKGIQNTCDYALGCNPMNRVFTTRLGQRCIWRPLHEYSRYSPNGPIPGIQCEGPSKQIGGIKATGGMTTFIAAALYPSGPWPILHTYTDIEIIPEMNEGIVVNQMKSAMAYAFLLP